MKAWTKFLILASLLFGSLAFAEGKLGAGFVLGGPTALSGKWFKTDEHAFDLQLAFFHDDYFLIYGDFLRHFPGQFNSREKFVRQLSPYVGVGPFFAFANDDHDHHHGVHHHHDHRPKYFEGTDDDFAFGVRVPFGIEWLWDKVPLGIGVEIAPGIVLVPHTDGVVHAGLTLRYYF